MSEDLTIETTDLYVRFLPADSLEINALDADTTLNLYDYPLDFEIEQVGHWYHDPSIPDHLPTYQYTVVKPDYQFPDTIQHELLAELFIPENHPDFVEPDSVASSGRTLSTLSTLSDLLLQMETMSLLATGNLPEEEQQLAEQNANGRTNWFWNNWFPPKWNPDGYVRVRERSGGITRGWLPVKGVRVRARRWFTIRTDYTDSRGYYRISSFRRPVNYSVVFQTSDVKITNWFGWAGRDNGPKRKGRWDVYYNWHSENWVKATLVNATAEYNVQRRRMGIKNPFPEGFWSWVGHRMNIRAVFKEGTGDMFAVRTNRIRAYSKFERGRGNKGTDDLYALTFHELGHQSHWKLNRWNITWSSRILRESWGEFIEYYFTREYYPNHPNVRLSSSTSIPNYDAPRIRASKKAAYTQLFVDLMDNDNQLTRFPGTDRADDRVRGYTFAQIQQAVKRSRQLDQVRDYLKNNYNNSTRGELDRLFNFYLQF